MYIAIMKIEEGIVTKYSLFEKEENAVAHVNKYKDFFPESFVTTSPERGGSIWRVVDKEVVVELPEKKLPPLNKIQFKTMIKVAGLEEAIKTAIANIPDAFQKALAEVKYTESLLYHRDNPLFDLLGPEIELTNEEIDALWLQALEIE